MLCTFSTIIPIVTIHNIPTTPTTHSNPTTHTTISNTTDILLLYYYVIMCIYSGTFNFVIPLSISLYVKNLFHL